MLNRVGLVPAVTGSMKQRVTLRGAPFKNPVTVKELLKKCIPPLSIEEAARIVEQATEHPETEATVIVCLENEAERYCRNLIDNGFESTIGPETKFDALLK